LAALHDLGVALHGYRASIGAAIPAERPLLTIPVHDVRRTAIPARADGRYFVVLWPGEVLSLDHPPTAPPKYVESNRQLRERMERLFGRTQLVEVRRQPDGSALLELWRAEDPLPRLRFLPEHREDVDTDEPGS
jgi:hypothetical protein